MERERLMQMMNVPDRIVLTGGDGYKGYEAQPLELMNDHINQVGEVYASIQGSIIWSVVIETSRMTSKIFPTQ